jgi:UDP-N-acetylmuramoyl-L-alanyl-D-glutamate--2,6-diaminopimelate ligase
MLLHDLLQRFDPRIDLEQLTNCAVTGVSEDSRQVRAGHVFIARPGTRTDGASFMSDATARGAVAAVVKTPDAACSLPQIVAADPAGAASRLANIIYDNPSHAVKVLGITGTNGKTTTAYLIRHLLQKAGKKCGLIGTVQIDDGALQSEATMTTPSATQIPQLLGQMRDNGCCACAMEVSSHALDQRRVAGVQFAAAALTNLTGDHLDYHKSMENYAAAKARLFEMLDPDAIAIVNARDPWSARIVRGCRAQVLRFGIDTDADYRADQISVTSQGSRFRLTTREGSVNISMSLIGRHNIENALVAVALVCQSFGLSPDQIAGGLAEAQGAPGRLQPVRSSANFAVLVDYAHTDDALENVLTALAPLTTGKLRVLFGCGGDRDRTKRPRMAAVAQRLADAVYVTSDNPRTEDAQSIISEILAGFTSDFRQQVFVDLDRRRAIERILSDSAPGDVVLLAGKGHENYQIVGTARHHFDDVEEASRFLNQMRAA